MTTGSYQSKTRLGGPITWAVQRILLATSLMFALQLVLQGLQGLGTQVLGMSNLYGLLTEKTMLKFPMLLRGCIWQPITYLFLHAGLMHLFSNMLWLYFFGPVVERRLGTRGFYVFYFACGIAAAIVGTGIPYLLSGGSLVPGLDVVARTAPTLGASGAVMAVLAAFAVMDPEQEVLIIPIPWPINARALVLIVIVMNIIQALQASHVAVGVHMAGLAAGYVYFKGLPFWKTGKGNSPFNKVKRARWRKKPSPKEGEDLGEAVDNIFKFDDKDRRK